MSDSDFLDDVDNFPNENNLGIFHGVYLLLSQDKKTYIGYTVNPERRLKQHNDGSLKGGAKATTGKGPWEMILIIHGFPNEIFALGFEWAWQNLDVSRRLKDIVGPKKRGENGLQYRLRGVANMLRVGQWCRLGLTIRWLCQAREEPFPVGLQPPNHMPIAYGPISLKVKSAQKKLNEERFLTQTQATNTACSICQRTMDKQFVTCLNNSCSGIWHLTCIGDEFLAQIYPSPYLLPVERKCPLCNVTLIWSQLIEDFIAQSARIKKPTEKKVQSMMAWADDMPQSQSDDGLEEVNIDTLQFSILSVIGVGETVSLAVQIVSIISVEYPPYQTIILVWDDTKPKYDLNKKFITCLPQATTVKHCIDLMAKLGGKLSNPYFSCILFSETLAELKQSFIRPGDYIYLTRVTICAPNTGPGVVLIGDQCRIGPLPQECRLYAELSDRIIHFSRHTICVADCISNDIGTLESFHLQDYGKMLQEISSQTVTMKESYKFKVVSVHPINEKEFYDSLLLYCTCCHRFIDDDSLSRTGDVSCRRSLVPTLCVIMHVCISLSIKAVCVQ